MRCQRCFRTAPSTCQVDHQKKRPKTSSASARREQVVEDAEQMSELFLQKDKVTSIHDIYQRIQSDLVTPSDVTEISKTDNLLLCIIDVDSATPHLSIGLRIYENLTYDCFLANKRLIKDNEIVNCPITLFSQVLNLIANLKSKIVHPKPPTFDDVLGELKSSLQDDLLESKAVHFFIEQLEVIRVPVNWRRYSKLTIVFAYLVWSTSASAYRALLQNEVLILPPERALRRITQKLGAPTQNTSINYLKARRSI